MGWHRERGAGSHGPWGLVPNVAAKPAEPLGRRAFSSVNAVLFMPDRAPESLGEMERHRVWGSTLDPLTPFSTSALRSSCF